MQYKENGRDENKFEPRPFVVNIACATEKNPFYRKELWTGRHLQLTLMCIPPCGEIGWETHSHHDQYLRIEQGRGIVKIGKRRERAELQQQVCAGDAIFVPAGAWHNLVNTDAVPLKLYSIYAPPHHPRGVIHHTKEEAEAEED